MEKRPAYCGLTLRERSRDSKYKTSAFIHSYNTGVGAPHASGTLPLRYTVQVMTASHAGQCALSATARARPGQAGHAGWMQVVSSIVAAKVG